MYISMRLKNNILLMSPWRPEEENKLKEFSYIQNY